jgi:hypothetical protein
MSEAGDDTAPSERSVPLGLLVTAIVVGAVVASVLGGAPKDLPGVALGSKALLFTLRALLFAAAGLLVLTVIWRAFERRLPDELTTTGIKYATVAKTRDLQESLAEDIETLQAQLDDTVASTTDLFAEMADRIKRLEAPDVQG